MNVPGRRCWIKEKDLSRGKPYAFNEKMRRNAVFLKQTVEGKSGPDIAWGKGGVVKNV